MLSYHATTSSVCVLLRLLLRIMQPVGLRRDYCLSLYVWRLFHTNFVEAWGSSRRSLRYPCVR
jgi:hypothetical protein